MMLDALMKNYLRENDDCQKRLRREYDFLPPVLSESHEPLPIAPENSEWVIDKNPERLKRIFTFETLDTRNWFVGELLDQEKATGHYGSISIDGMEVIVEVYTHDVGRVTELDQEYASFCDDVFQDVSYLDALPGRIKLNVHR